jgi:hypothetical protein
MVSVARGTVGLSVVGPTVVVMEGNQQDSAGQGAGPSRDRPLSLAECRERVAAATEAVRVIGAVLWQTPSGGGPDGLAGLMGEVDALGMACDAGRSRCCGRRWTAVRPPAVRRR